MRNALFLLTCSTILFALPLAHAGNISECDLAPGSLFGLTQKNGDLYVGDSVRHTETTAYPIRRPNDWTHCYAMGHTLATEMKFPNFVYGKFIDSSGSEPIIFLVDEESPEIATVGDQRHFTPDKNCFACDVRLLAPLGEGSTEKDDHNFAARTEDECSEFAENFLKAFYEKEAEKAVAAKEKNAEGTGESTDTFVTGANVWAEWEADDQTWPIKNSDGEVYLSRFEVEEILAETISKTEEAPEKDIIR